MVLRRIFGPKKDKVKEGGGKNLSSVSNAIVGVWPNLGRWHGQEM
jgi:hypothetical protein